MAGSRDIRIGVKIDGIDQTRQDFAAIGAAVKSLGVENELVAGEITKGFAQIQAASGRVAAGIERDGKVSQSALDGLIADFGRTKDAVERAFPGGAPDALNTALQTAESRIRATVAAADELPGKLEAARNAFQKLEAAPTALSAAFTRVETNLERFREELSETGDVGKGELEKITKAQALLEIEIKKSVGSYDKLDANAKQAYDRIQREANEARTTVVQLEKANNDIERSLDGAVRGYTTLDDALDQVRTRLGDVGMAAGAAGGALAAGWAMGMQANAALRTDMSEFDSWLQGFLLRANLMIRATVDQVVANFAVVGAAWESLKTRDLDPLKAAMKEATDTGTEGAKLLTAAFTGTDESVRNLAIQFGIASTALDDHREAQDLEREAAAKAAEEAARLAEEKKRLQEQIDKVTVSIAKETEALEKQRRTATEAEVKQYDPTSQLKGAEGTIRRLTSTLDELRVRFAAAVKDYGENSAAAKNLALEIAQYETALERATARAAGLTEELRKYKSAQEQAESAAKRHEERIKDLNEKVGELSGTTTSATAATKASTEAAVSFAGGNYEVADSLTTSTNASTGYKTVLESTGGAFDDLSIKQVTVKMTAEEVAEANRKATTEQKKQEEATAAQSTATEKASAAFDTMATKINAVSFDGINGKLDSILSKLDSVPVKAERAATAIEKLANAGDDDEDDGITITRAGGGAIEPGSLGGGTFRNTGDSRNVSPKR
jgi:hypothetical protein